MLAHLTANACHEGLLGIRAGLLCGIPAGSCLGIWLAIVFTACQGMISDNYSDNTPPTMLRQFAAIIGVIAFCTIVVSVILSGLLGLIGIAFGTITTLWRHVCNVPK